MRFSYDVIVIGAGHAGCEAACAAANLGSSTLLITMDMNKIAQMSCNPAVGGIAKGQIVREIDALGGQMGIVTDRASIQFRMLNRSKGPAMWSPRAQVDRTRFIAEWRKVLDNTPNLYLWQDVVMGLVVADGEVRGVTTALGGKFRATCVVLTVGTFLNGLIHVGHVQMGGGRVAEPASYGLTEQLCEMGFAAGRMKTGTPVRLDARTIDFSKAQVQDGDHDFHHFSYLSEVHSQLQQRPCYIVYTNPEVHRILREDLPNSPLYNGQINSTGPRYCPSIETKLVTFPDKDQHLLFIEPEGETTNEMYLNGFSSSMPWHTQIKALSHIPALEHVQAYRPGYAIEYDYFDPTQLKHTLETKKVKNLFFAGQINGTTGYEEAAGQGMVAGINAHQNAVGNSPFVIGRDEAYIGVLIDDLVTKGVDEPYRMFTSRAEHRILLRQDDADLRLTGLSHDLGLASDERYESMRLKWRQVDSLVEFTQNHTVKAHLINPELKKEGLQTLRQSVRLHDLLLRPQLNFAILVRMVPELKAEIGKLELARCEEIVEAAEIQIKYQGYIEREKMQADKIGRLDKLKIRGKFDYDTITSITIEARQKLKKIDPETVGQASRIPGISPSDINILLLLLGR